MRERFADAGYWIALLHPFDTFHDMAVSLSAALGRTRLVTTEMALVEVLDFFSRFGPRFRQTAAETVRRLRADPNTLVIAQTSDLFDQALELYERRPDKDWGFVDCASFVIMQERGITEAVAHDHHFIQAGFKALLRGQ